MEEDGNGSCLEILGARQNNLKNIDVRIPHNALTVITGVSGSGKSSLAFDTLYAEGQRRYVESMSAYARQFLERISKPLVREIRGISPAIAIRQKNTGRNPRSTVGTVTEIYDFMRLLFARVGTLKCRNCGEPIQKDFPEEAAEFLMALPEGTRLMVTLPFEGSSLDLTHGQTDSSIRLSQQVDNLVRQGFYRLVPPPLTSPTILQLPQHAPRSDKELKELSVLVDRLVVREDALQRLTESIEIAYAESQGVCDVTLLLQDQKESETIRFSERFECQKCNITYRRPEPRLFSFNNPYGACPTCQGFGNIMTLDKELVVPDPGKTLTEGAIEPFARSRYKRFQKQLLEFAEARGIATDVPWAELSPETRRMIWQGEKKFSGVEGFFKYLDRKKYKVHVRIFISRYRSYTLCPDCEGTRLCQEARDVFIGGRRITELTQLPVHQSEAFFSTLDLAKEEKEIAGRLLDEIVQRLRFLVRVGLDYLTLDRLTSTLSGGETQRIHLSASLGSALVGTLYVLDEPSIGLHARDQEKLLEILQDLRDLGNTVIVVEHEKELIQGADHIIDMGPGAGEQGGHITHSGDLVSLLEQKGSLTGQYLRGDLKISTPVFRRRQPERSLLIRGARQHNLQSIDVRLPLHSLVCVTGVSGSGKSTLIYDVLYAGIKKKRGEWKLAVGRFDEIQGWEYLTDILMVDQSPIGKTPRSNPVTYLKAFDHIRKIFSDLGPSRALGLSPAHFSFNVAGGRCETCQGSGSITVEMQFLADVEVTCEDCRGTRFQNRILEIKYKGKNIHDVLNLTVREAIRFFKEHSALRRKLNTLQEVGLGYLRLGQSSTTLSGGEAQRIKLASFLTKKTAGHPLFIFDEPTTGLHFDDISKLLKAFDRLVSRGASLVVIEHNLDVIKSADWIIDLGPEGGDKGGKIVAVGDPESLMKNSDSLTGRYLKHYASS